MAKQKAPAAIEIEAAGFKNTAEFCRLIGESSQNLNNWYENYPTRFKIVLAGAKLLRKELEREYKKKVAEDGK